jgi:hypothetical protein
MKAGRGWERRENSKSPLTSPVMSMKVFGFTVLIYRKDAETQRNVESTKTM